MDVSNIKAYFERIQEYVSDENKTVTCMSLAKDLNISLQFTKQLLNKFVDQQIDLETHKYGITYMISGILKQTGDLAVNLVKFEDLNAKLSEMEKVLFKQVFSIQQCTTVNYNALALVDKVSERDEILIGLITSERCKKREQATIPITLPEVTKSIVKHERKGSINSFFNVNTKATKNGNSFDDKKSNGVESSSFKENIPLDPQSECSSGQSSASIDSLIKKEKSPVSIKKSGKPDKTLKSEKLQSKKSSTPKAKTSKRKRITEVSDSDNDIFSDDNDIDSTKETCDDELPPEPAPQIIVPSKNKRRKAIQKTYTDDEGYIVSRLEYITETTSGDEGVIPEENQNEKKVCKSATITTKLESTKSESDLSKDKKGKTKKLSKNKSSGGYQSTLTSFFSKK